MAVAIIGALITSLPVTWVYMATRTSDEYDQSIISTILILPSVVTSIVVVVQHSLALAFALGGIAGAVRFKNSLKSSGDALYILLSVGIGLASGIGAVELALVMSLAFNYCFVGAVDQRIWRARGNEALHERLQPGRRDRQARPPLRQPPKPAAATAPPAKPMQFLSTLVADRLVGRNVGEEAAEIGERLAPRALRHAAGSGQNRLDRAALAREVRCRGQRLRIVPAIAPIVARS